MGCCAAHVWQVCCVWAALQPVCTDFEAFCFKIVCMNLMNFCVFMCSMCTVTCCVTGFPCFAIYTIISHFVCGMRSIGCTAKTSRVTTD
ncbi:hypothetical protein BY996DRAFT_8289247 [Phakopsora pachyrhizi]|nr:hypothetical protein BY996DRAFT_8289247 [Phakopsora pachyrhizi]